MNGARLTLTLTLDELRQLLRRKAIIATCDDRRNEILIEMDFRDRDRAREMLDGGEGTL